MSSNNHYGSFNYQPTDDRMLDAGLGTQWNSRQDERQLQNAYSMSNVQGHWDAQRHYEQHGQQQGYQQRFQNTAVSSATYSSSTQAAVSLPSVTAHTAAYGGDYLSGPRRRLDSYQYSIPQQQLTSSQIDVQQHQHTPAVSHKYQEAVQYEYTAPPQQPSLQIRQPTTQTLPPANNQRAHQLHNQQTSTTNNSSEMRRDYSANSHSSYSSASSGIPSLQHHSALANQYRKEMPKYQQTWAVGGKARSAPNRAEPTQPRINSPQLRYNQQHSHAVQATPSTIAPYQTHKTVTTHGQQEQSRSRESSAFNFAAPTAQSRSQHKDNLLRNDYHYKTVEASASTQTLPPPRMAMPVPHRVSDPSQQSAAAVPPQQKPANEVYRDPGPPARGPTLVDVQIPTHVQPSLLTTNPPRPPSPFVMDSSEPEPESALGHTTELKPATTSVAKPELTLPTPGSRAFSQPPLPSSSTENQARAEGTNTIISESPVMVTMPMPSLENASAASAALVPKAPLGESTSATIDTPTGSTKSKRTYKPRQRKKKADATGVLGSEGPIKKHAHLIGQQQVGTEDNLDVISEQLTARDVGFTLEQTRDALTRGIAELSKKQAPGHPPSQTTLTNSQPTSPQITTSSQVAERVPSPASLLTNEPTKEALLTSISPVINSLAASESSANNAVASQVQTTKRKPGRPRKKKDSKPNDSTDVPATIRPLIQKTPSGFSLPGADPAFNPIIKTGASTVTESAQELPVGAAAGMTARASEKPNESDSAVMEKTIREMLEQVRRVSTMNPELFSAVWESIRKEESSSRLQDESATNSITKSVNTSKKDAVPSTPHASQPFVERNALSTAAQQPSANNPTMPAPILSTRAPPQKPSDASAVSTLPQLATSSQSHVPVTAPASTSKPKTTITSTDTQVPLSSSAHLTGSVEKQPICGAAPKLGNPAGPDIQSTLTKPNSIWPEQMKFNLAKRCVMYLTLKNVEKSILGVKEMESILDQNPTFGSLCAALKLRGYTIENGELAQELLSEAQSSHATPTPVSEHVSSQQSSTLHPSRVQSPSQTAGASQSSATTSIAGDRDLKTPSLAQGFPMVSKEASSASLVTALAQIPQPSSYEKFSDLWSSCKEKGKSSNGPPQGVMSSLGAKALPEKPSSFQEDAVSNLRKKYSFLREMQSNPFARVESNLRTTGSLATPSPNITTESVQVPSKPKRLLVTLDLRNSKSILKEFLNYNPDARLRSGNVSAPSGVGVAGKGQASFGNSSLASSNSLLNQNITMGGPQRNSNAPSVAEKAPGEPSSLYNKSTIAHDVLKASGASGFKNFEGTVPLPTPLNQHAKRITRLVRLGYSRIPGDLSTIDWERVERDSKVVSKGPASQRELPKPPDFPAPFPPPLSTSDAPSTPIEKPSTPKATSKSTPKSTPKVVIPLADDARRSPSQKRTASDVSETSRPTPKRARMVAVVINNRSDSEDKTPKKQGSTRPLPRPAIPLPTNSYGVDVRLWQAQEPIPPPPPVECPDDDELEERVHAQYLKKFKCDEETWGNLEEESSMLRTLRHYGLSTEILFKKFDSTNTN